MHTYVRTYVHRYVRRYVGTYVHTYMYICIEVQYVYQKHALGYAPCWNNPQQASDLDTKGSGARLPIDARARDWTCRLVGSHCTASGFREFWGSSTKQGISAEIQKREQNQEGA